MHESDPAGDFLSRLSPEQWTVVLVGLHILLGLLVYEPVLLANGDNAGYMILGEALRTGEGYRDLHLPGAPVHVKFPPLYPALLAGLGFLGGVQLFKLASLALTATVVAVTILLGRRWLGFRGGLLAGAVVALNPLLLEYGHYVMSEALFTALLVFSLYAVGRSNGTTDWRGARGDRSSRGAGNGVDAWWWMGLTAAVAAFLTRTVGLALLLGIMVYPLFRRDIRRFATAGVTTAAAAGGWALFQRLAAPERSGYLKEWLMIHPYDPAAGTVSVSGMLERVAGNLWTYLSWFFPSAVTGLAEGYSGGGILVGVIGLALTALAFGGWLVRCRQSPGATEGTIFFYVCILAVWPSLWVDRRFLVPVVPLLVLYLLVGAAAAFGAAARITDRIRDTGRPVAVPRDGTRRKSPRPLRGRAQVGAGLVAVCLIALSSIRLAARVPERVECTPQSWRGSPCQEPAFESFFRAAEWARTNTGRESVFISAKPRLFYLKSGRRSRIYEYSDRPDEVLRDIVDRGTEYVVVDALPGIGGTTQRYLKPAVEAYPSRFTLVYRGGEPETLILRVLKGREPGRDTNGTSATVRDHRSGTGPAH